MKLRYTLNDGIHPVYVQANWFEELYYGPVRVTNGVAEVPDNDEVSIFVLCNRGFSPIVEQKPKKIDKVEKAEEEISEKVLMKKSREWLNENAGRFGMTEDAEGFGTKPELVAAILQANEGGGE